MQSRILQYLSPLVSSVMHACLILGWLSPLFAWALYLCMLCDVGYDLGIRAQVYWNLATNGVYLTRCTCATRSTVYISSNHGIHMHFVPRQLHSESILLLAQRFLQKSCINRLCSVWQVGHLSFLLLTNSCYMQYFSPSIILNNWTTVGNNWRLNVDV